MKYSINIDQINSIEWGFNLSEAAVFTYLFNVHTWADHILIDDKLFYFAARQKTCQDVPLISEKADTIYRIYKTLHEKGVIEYLKHMGKDCIRITEKGKAWNSEKFPNITIELGNKSESTRKIFRKRSEINPTYKSTIDNTTNDKIIEPKIKIELHDQIEQTKVEVYDVVKATQTKYIQPPTIENLVPVFLEKLLEKQKQHPNIVDCWNWANHQAEAFWLNHDKTGWKVQKLGGAIDTWINRAIQYKTVIMPCPVQYKGNPQQKQAQVKQIAPMMTVSKEDLEQRRQIFDNAFNKLG
jgi:DNA-binding PadR family transcriptional regulator